MEQVDDGFQESYPVGFHGRFHFSALTNFNGLECLTYIGTEGYGPVTRLIESVYLLGGEERLARGLRPGFRRRLNNRQAAMGGGSSVETTRTGPQPKSFVTRVAGRWFRRSVA